MPGIRSPLMTWGVAVVSASAEIDHTHAKQLQTVLIDPAGHGHGRVVVDMIRTRFRDSSGRSALLQAPRRAVAEGGELRLVLPADGPAVRVVTLTGLDQALTPGPTVATMPVHPRPPAGLRSHVRQSGRPGEGM